LWHFILEAGGYDPLRAQEIEAQVSQEWWERWWVDREERIRAAPRRDSAGAQARPRSQEPPGLTRQRYQLTPDGQLAPTA
jgi:hypothetical protein